jgi:hypothetical protein
MGKNNPKDNIATITICFIIIDRFLLTISNLLIVIV